MITLFVIIYKNVTAYGNLQRRHTLKIHDFITMIQKTAIGQVMM